MQTIKNNPKPKDFVNLIGQAEVHSIENKISYRSSALNWWKNLKEDAKRDFVKVFQDSLPHVSGYGSMKYWDFSLIDSSGSSIERIYKYMNNIQ